jgi:outer membrane protein OmpA-like peptidoglycan-associated protein
MKNLPVRSSLLALTIFMAPLPALAEQSPAAVPAGFLLAQAEETDAGGGDRIAAIQQFLASKRPLAKLPDNRLEQRLKRARVFLRTKDLPQELQAQLNQEIQEIEAEAARRQSAQTAAPAEQPAASAEQPAAPAGQTAEQPPSSTQPDTSGAAQTTQSGSGAPNDVAVFLKDTRPLSSLSNQELRTRFRTANQLSKAGNINQQTRRQLRDIARAARAELDARMKGTQASGGTGDGQTGTGTAADASGGSAGTAAGSGEAEDKAKALLADSAPVAQMSDADLRKRLQAMRDLLAGDKLSPATKRALRQKLAEDRRVLRSRLNSGSNQQGANTTTINNNTVINNQTVTVILKDRRPAKDLSDAELRRRIRVLREALRDTKYSEQDRRAWRELVDNDRRYLNRRLLDERRRRQNDLTIGVNSGKLNIELGMQFRPDRRPPPYIFAAEADDEDLEAVLIAPPRREIDRRYSVEEISESPDLRNAVARIEIDTVHFGFGEGFLREEEVENLERIAEIMERILATHPDEVFMIEGHTDAVGSNAANLALSRERALAVKQALVNYFVIPPENLKTVGLGERFLKIPTEEAEAENRRVSVARITPLVGKLQR